MVINSLYFIVHSEFFNSLIVFFGLELIAELGGFFEGGEVPKEIAFVEVFGVFVLIWEYCLSNDLFAEIDSHVVGVIGVLDDSRNDVLGEEFG